MTQQLNFKHKFIKILFRDTANIIILPRDKTEIAAFPCHGKKHCLRGWLCKATTGPQKEDLEYG